MDLTPDRVLANLREVRARIAAAAGRSGRAPPAVRLVAVTKTVGPETVRVLVGAGQADVGENHAQAIRDRSRDLADLSVRWHMIGPLQRNKVKYVVPACAMIHSVDSEAVLAEIAKRAAAAGARADCLLEVNISGEASKHGIRPEEARAAAEAAAARPSVRLAGLMTMPPLVDDAETVRPIFAALRDLRDRLNREAALAEPLAELSMGMTQDYEVAIEEGATIVRVGTALFR
jgi:hypothetical protein